MGAALIEVSDDETARGPESSQSEITTTAFVADSARSSVDKYGDCHEAAKIAPLNSKLLMATGRLNLTVNSQPTNRLTTEFGVINEVED
ncbi:MAG: hypothetical protein ISQ06_16330 [Planctomycetaceae bacterium]|jgi:hypothetical protein|nr:hypothetical protein [Planctomycetaceae bacterium]